MCGVGGVAHAAAPRPSLASSAAQEKNRLHERTGEEIFRALIFGQGSLARELGPLAPILTQTPEVAEVVDQLSRHIREADESFFARFGGSVISADVKRIDGALREAGGRIADSLQALGHIDATGATGAAMSSRFAAIQVVLFAVAGLVVGVAAVLVTAAVATQTVMYPARTGSSGPVGVSLSYEQWVADIARAFS